MNRRTILTIGAGAALAASTAHPARAAETLNLAVGQQGSWDAMTAQLGVDLGYFKKEGLDLNIAYTAGGPDTIQAVTTGSADMGFAVGTTAVIAAFAKGAPVRIVAAQMTGSVDLYFYVKGDSPINKFSDMNGKSIGYTRLGSSSYTVERSLADQYGVKPTFVATGELPATLTQVMSGQVDAGWGTVPQLLDQVHDKKLKIIGRGSDAKAIAGQTIRVNIANANLLASKRDVALRFYRAYSAANDYILNNLDKAIAYYAKYAQLPLEQAKLMKPFIDPKAYQLRSVMGMSQSIADAIEFKLIKEPLTADQQKGILDILAPEKK
jgi:NitT/TauT family transport system substrate-binding protein